MIFVLFMSEEQVSRNSSVVDTLSYLRATNIIILETLTDVDHVSIDYNFGDTIFFTNREHVSRNSNIVDAFTNHI